MHGTEVRSGITNGRAKMDRMHDYKAGAPLRAWGWGIRSWSAAAGAPPWRACPAAIVSCAKKIGGGGRRRRRVKGRGGGEGRASLTAARSDTCNCSALQWTPGAKLHRLPTPAPTCRARVTAYFWIDGTSSTGTWRAAFGRCRAGLGMVRPPRHGQGGRERHGRRPRAAGGTTGAGPCLPRRSRPRRAGSLAASQQRWRAERRPPARPGRRARP